MVEYLFGELLPSVASEAVFLAAGALVALLVRLWRNVGKRRVLKKAFGQNVERADDVQFYLPLWRVKPGDRAIPRFLKPSAMGEPAEFYGPDNTYAVEDAGAAFSVSQLFGAFFSRPIAFQSDITPLNLATTNILIGTEVANQSARAVLARYRAVAADDLPVEFSELEETDDNQSAQEIVEQATGQRYGFDGRTDYAVILRLPKIEDGEGFHFIVGGIDASGTEAAGRMLRAHWRRFAKFKGPVALILCLERGDPESRRGVVWVHRRGKDWAVRPAKTRPEK